ncbi:hypothetical protein [Vibrio vulnificus]|uniref:hypothetical protein n=1 Tax=Vibrio vulnificus TaxID=672 RepID=UPI0005F0FCDE|nr:hypothetical protein [Vibrio vulnificus]
MENRNVVLRTLKMKEIYIVTTNKNYFAQRKYPWQSMDIDEITKELERNSYKVRKVSINDLCNKLHDIKNKIIIYTSSQVDELKLYINDLAYFLKEENILIPSYESLLAHDNKGFQVMLNKKYDLGIINSRYYADISDVLQNENKFPFVLKTVNGASSQGVSLVKTESDVMKFMTWPRLYQSKLFAIKSLIKRLIIKSKYDQEWESYRSYGNKRYVVQDFIDGLNSDYKVLVFGGKYYVLNRGIPKGDFKASGSGIHCREFGEDIFTVLDQARKIVENYPSHIYSLDICVSDNKALTIECQFTHVGPVTLIDSEFYYIFSSGKWIKIKENSNLEKEFSNSILCYLSGMSFD